MYAMYIAHKLYIKHYIPYSLQLFLQWKENREINFIIKYKVNNILIFLQDKREIIFQLMVFY